jgi:hypothetical protein
VAVAADRGSAPCPAWRERPARPIAEPEFRVMTCKCRARPAARPAAQETYPLGQGLAIADSEFKLGSARRASDRDIPLLRPGP